MTLQVIIGAQWGDEGKGRIVDWYAREAEFTARCNGGDNAGHTVTVGPQVYRLHLVPSGIIHPQIIAVMGNGMVINPRTLLEEMDLLRQGGVEITPGRLRISHAAHLITPGHRALDAALELRRGGGSLGTTGRGIGPAYTDKARRLGLRITDLLAHDLTTRLSEQLESCNRMLRSLGADPLEKEPTLAAFTGYADQLRGHIADTGQEVRQALAAGRKVIVEGAQGTLLDVDHGTYPFVTSSSTTAAGALTGLGLGLDAARRGRVIGVVKAFQTRVGAGPFPTELRGEMASRLRGSGANPWDEFGTTTGRPRRVGWLDTVLLRYAVQINGIDELAVTKMDILSGLEKVSICTAYERNGERYEQPPLGLSDLGSFTPIYEQLPGWQADLGAVRRWADLPAEARGYLQRIAELAGAPVRLVSVGPERDQVVEGS